MEKLNNAFFEKFLQKFLNQQLFPTIDYQASIFRHCIKDYTFMMKFSSLVNDKR